MVIDCNTTANITTLPSKDILNTLNLLINHTHDNLPISEIMYTTYFNCTHLNIRSQYHQYPFGIVIDHTFYPTIIILNGISINIVEPNSVERFTATIKSILINCYNK